jgi:type II secretory pathway pseudopilin PulG
LSQAATTTSDRSDKVAAIRDTTVGGKYNEHMELGQGNDGNTRRLFAPEGGYAMAALLVGLSIMGVLLSMALPVWSHFTKREREEELIWRGQQYARAIMLFQRKFANTFPPNIDVLVERRFLRKKYKDPITNEDFQPIPVTGAPSQGGPQAPGQGPIPQVPSPQGSQPPQGSQSFQGSQSQPGSFSLQQRAGPGGNVPTLTMAPVVGIQGVVSKSNATSIKTYNGRTKYNEWAFVYVATAQRVGPGGGQQPGVPPGSQQAPGTFQRGGATFTPMGGVDRRPGVNPSQPFPGTGPSGFPPGGGQFPQQPSPFRPPSPFSPSGQPPPPPPRPPGS